MQTSSTSSDTRPILVTGATGKTGSRIAARLRAMGVPVRAGSRSASPAFDWEAPATWRAALQGTRAVYVCYQPDLAVPAALATVTAFFTLARELGVNKLVLLSGRGEREAEQAEDALRASGVDWTIIRAAWFAQNFSEGLMLEPLLEGELALPVAGVREPFIDVEDIAEIAVAALTTERHRHQLYEVTGPRSMSFAEAVQEIAQASGQPMRYTTVPNEAYRAALAAAQTPPEVTGLVMYLFETLLDGRNERLTDGVQRALGRPARDFSDFARQAAAAGAWKARLAA
ncbi:NAD(P)H-binding protein [Piscinibacter sp. HJYY11]|uniref:NAD(P)H-binding protein n=1 Tax=Piscinibacter sp. HJYY11 TaxID=2801333 RepID=UPI00191F357C|nr:NAD(P)H-binding protein [Piscinibacter sp. HJYY11]MBL0730073.1 NAD(P)H-binding protein [Piscinibacter sp. HJYY11]